VAACCKQGNELSSPIDQLVMDDSYLCSLQCVLLMLVSECERAGGLRTVAAGSLAAAAAAALTRR
jgi:hypothetical protein